MKMTNKNGLTIVEILVAVTIIALLAAGLYSVSNYLEKQAKIKLTESTIEALSAAIEQYRDFNGHFPFVTGTGSYGLSQLQTTLNGTVVNPTDYNDIYASSDALYYILNQVPASKKIIDNLNRSLVTNKDYKGTEYFILINGVNYPLIHIIDPWKCPLRYTYKDSDNFPLIESTGPDRDFNTPDDISSR